MQCSEDTTHHQKEYFKTDLRLICICFSHGLSFYVDPYLLYIHRKDAEVQFGQATTCFF